ncbi:MAG: helix-turn-helix transcriptional regulator [Deltaproteobacteria bacterium]|nr:helix-turn-helix transcriptional regulator [Deltaproteobacteria bacterium]
MDNLVALKRLIGRNIRALRKTRGWSQEVLGESADLSYKFVGEIERGTVNPSLDSLMKIAKALNVEIAELFLTEKLFVLSGKDIDSIKTALTILNSILGNYKTS